MQNVYDLQLIRYFRITEFACPGFRKETILESSRYQKKLQIIEIYQDISKQVRRLGGQIFSGKENLQTGEMQLGYVVSDSMTMRFIPKETLSRLAGYIAIVIDDFGYHTNPVITDFIDLPFQLTYAIIPGLPYTKTISKILAEAGKPVLIHMPMEALTKKVEQNGFELFVGMKPQEIRSRVRRASRAIPRAKGMNNHMGSRATLDDSLLFATLSELKALGLFFVDSKTHSQTRAYKIAQRLDVPSKINDIFLDNNDDIDYIKKRLFAIADIAAENGSAVGIGHHYVATLEALRAVVPQLQKRGFQFVPVGYLIDRENTDSLHIAQLPAIRRN